MNLTEELFQVLSQVVAGDRTLEDLEDWMASRVQEIADEPGQETRPIVDDIWFLLDDYAHRLFSHELLYKELAQVLAEEKSGLARRHKVR